LLIAILSLVSIKAYCKESTLKNEAVKIIRINLKKEGMEVRKIFEDNLNKTTNDQYVVFGYAKNEDDELFLLKYIFTRY